MRSSTYMSESPESVIRAGTTLDETKDSLMPRAKSSKSLAVRTRTEDDVWTTQLHRVARRSSWYVGLALGG